MRLLFLGSVMKTEDCTKHLGPSVAGNKMQMGIIKELFRFYNEKMSILTEYPVAAYPREKVIYMDDRIIELTKGITARRVPFLNFFILKQTTLIINAFFQICKWAIVNRNEPKVVLCFNAFPYVALPIQWAANLFKFKTICILADPPIEVLNRGFLGRIAKKIEDDSTRCSINKFDGLVVLNEHAALEYAPASKYIVVDGGFDLEDLEKVECGGQWKAMESDECFRVVYSGAIIEYNGIKNLLEVSKKINNTRFRLEIYGDGPLVQYVKDRCEDDPRISYMGNKPNVEIMQIQQKAALLVNPRHIDEPISKFTFPSKIIEYMLSGTPIITTKLNGLTDEYLNYMFVFEDEEPESMARTIDNILNKDKNELIQKATLAREFVIKEKNWKVQSNRIIVFVDKIVNEKIDYETARHARRIL